MLRILTLTCGAALVAFALSAQEGADPQSEQDTTPPPTAQAYEPPMTVQRLSQILLVLDPDAVVEGGGVTLTVADVPVTVVVDPRADRMRVLVPISSADDLDEADMSRLLQANFDTALDARYAIANNRLWATYIHPLSPLEAEQLVSGVAQTVTLARTYGDTYTSGAIIFNGGDTRSILEELRNLGEEL